MFEIRSDENKSHTCGFNNRSSFQTHRDDATWELVLRYSFNPKIISDHYYKFF